MGSGQYGSGYADCGASHFVWLSKRGRAEFRLHARTSNFTINQFIELFPAVDLIHSRRVLDHAAKSSMAVHQPFTEINWFES